MQDYQMRKILLKISSILDLLKYRVLLKQIQQFSTVLLVLNFRFNALLHAQKIKLLFSEIKYMKNHLPFVLQEFTQDT